MSYSRPHKFTITFSQPDYEALLVSTMSDAPNEGAALLLCGTSSTTTETRFLVHDVVPVAPGHYLLRQPLQLSIDSASYTAVAKRAIEEDRSVFFVHSHPSGSASFSRQDDREEGKLHEFLSARIARRYHGSIVIAPGRPPLSGRCWIAGSWRQLDSIRVLGSGRFQFFFPADSNQPIAEFFDRQVLAFGEDLQRLLARLHVGIVGAGGTGSAVAEQLARLGVGTLSVFDGDDLEASNVSRVYGSRVSLAGKNKAKILGKHISAMELGTKVIVHPAHINYEQTAKHMRDCDIVFSCSDKHRPRAILCQLAVRYLIPVFDLGVVIDSTGGVITDVTGRVTLLMPDCPCLFCRGRIDARTVALEAKSKEDREEEIRSGYATELPTNDPAVIPFTSSVASLAVQMLIQKLTGFMGEEHNSSEILYLYHDNKVRGNSTHVTPGCFCTDERKRARGDTRLFLDQTWPST